LADSSRASGPGGLRGTRHLRRSARPRHALGRENVDDSVRPVLPFHVRDLRVGKRDHRRSRVGQPQGGRRRDAPACRLETAWQVWHRCLPSRCGSRIKEVRCSLLIAITDDPGLATAVQGRDHRLWGRLGNRRRVHGWVRHGRVHVVDRLVHGGGARRLERRKNRSRYRCGNSGGALCWLVLHRLCCGLRLRCRRRQRWWLGLR
jgi:hypothetical protein